jgi:hypothetical protein
VAKSPERGKSNAHPPTITQEAANSGDALSLDDVGRERSASRSPSAASDEARQARVRELMDRLALRLSRSADGLSAEPIGDGRRKLHLGGRFQHAAVADRQADVSFQVECASDADEVHALLSAEPVR